MKLTNKNYDMTGFELSRLTRLLIILRVYSVGNWELQMGLKDDLLNIGKLWVQHYLGADNVIVSRLIAALRYILGFVKRLVVRLKQN